MCHTAIVSREYGIPCVVCTKDATKLIKDGSKITIEEHRGDYKEGDNYVYRKIHKSVILTYIGITAVVGYLNFYISEEFLKRVYSFSDACCGSCSLYLR